MLKIDKDSVKIKDKHIKYITDSIKENPCFIPLIPPNLN